MADDQAQEQTALVPVREQQVQFYGDQLLAAEGADKQIYVPLRPICDAMGLGWGSQYNRLRRDPVLNEALIVFIMKTVQGDRPMQCLPLKFLPGWLFGVTTARVRPELRDKILRYQRECYDVLWNAFKADILPATAPPFDLSPAEQALALAVIFLLAEMLFPERKRETGAGVAKPALLGNPATLAAQ